MTARANLWWAAAFALLLSGCSPRVEPRAGMVDRDNPNRGANIRIVSLNPCADAILAEIAPENLVAVSHYSHDLRSSSMDLKVARRFAATSGTAEEIAAVAPDAVVASAFLPPATERALAGMGFEVVKLGSISSLEDARAQIRQLAALAGRKKRGEKMIDRIDDAVAHAAPRDDPTQIPALVWQSGGLVPGEDTLIGDLLVKTGFRHFSATRGLGQGAILPLERVLADPPRVVVLAGGDADSSNRTLGHPVLADLAPATRMEHLPARLLWCGGPAIPATVAQLAGIRDRVGP